MVESSLSLFSCRVAAVTNASTRVGQPKPDTLHHLALAKPWHIGEVLGAELMGRYQGKGTYNREEVKGLKTQGTCLRETSLEMELGMGTDWRLGAWDSKVEELFLRRLAWAVLNSTEAAREVT